MAAARRSRSIARSASAGPSVADTHGPPERVGPLRPAVGYQAGKRRIGSLFAASSGLAQAAQSTE
jgi:hypothetical protein